MAVAYLFRTVKCGRKFNFFFFMIDGFNAVTRTSFFKRRLEKMLD